MNLKAVLKAQVGREYFRENEVLKISNKELLEELSKIEHDQWIEWSKSVSSEVSDERRKRWKKYWVEYEDLSEEVKEQDRVYARKILDVINKHTGE